MKRLILLCAIAIPVFGLTRSPQPGNSIGVLRLTDQYASRAERAIASTIERDLPDALADRGFKAFDAGVTFDELQRGGAQAADYYLEVVSSDALTRPVGGAGAAVGPVGIDVGIVVAHVAAEVRVYDGHTLALVDRYNLQEKSTAVVPTGVGVGIRPLWAFVGLPLVQYGQYRSAAHEVARHAAALIAGR